jgi:four helix bundle protein
VWQKAMDLVDEVYDLSRELPIDERFGLKSQMTRAAVSVPTNIAEGRARATSKDFANFLTIAWSSLMEIDTLVAIAMRRKFTTEENAARVFSLQIEVGKMLVALEARVRARKYRRNAPNP